MGCRRATEPVHGELVLSPADVDGFEFSLRNRRAASRGSLREDLRGANVSGRSADAAAIVVRNDRYGPARRFCSRVGRFDLSAPATNQPADLRTPAAPGGPLPLLIHPHFFRGLRGRL